MESSTFRAGTTPGSPDSYGEIKMLILYCLNEAGTDALRFETLHEAFSEYELVNYFALTETLDQLSASGHLSREIDGGEALFSITRLGKAAAREFETSIPFSVRRKASAALRTVVKRRKRLAEVSVSEKPSQHGGYMLELSIPDRGEDMMSVRVFAPGREEANLIKKRFLNDPVFIYKGIMALLTGDRSVMGEASPEDEALF